MGRKRLYHTDEERKEAGSLASWRYRQRRNELIELGKRARKEEIEDAKRAGLLSEPGEPGRR